MSAQETTRLNKPFWLVAALIVGVSAGLMWLKSSHQSQSVRWVSQLDQPRTVDATSLQEVTHEGVLNVRHFKTRYNVPVFWAPAKGLPMVDIRVVFPAGIAHESDLRGVAYLTSANIGESTKQLSGEAIREAFDQVGAQFSPSVTRDLASVSLRSLKDAQYLVPALKTLEQILSETTFNQDAFERIRAQARVALKKQDESPSALGAKAFYEQLYPEQPYGRSSLGDEGSLDQVTLNELVTFHANHYNRDNAQIVIVGDVDLVEVSAIAEFLTASMPSGAVVPKLNQVPVVSEVPPKSHIDFQSDQTHIYYGTPLLTWYDKDMPSFVLGNEILGQLAMNNRLFKSIRTEMGLAYSVGSRMTPMQLPGPFMVTAQTHSDEADKALDRIKTIIKDYVAEGPSDDEVARAKKAWLGSFALGFDSNRALVGALTNLSFYGLPLSYYDELRDGVMAQDATAIRDVFQARLNPEQMTLVTVGPASS